ncbi:hypothetical protein E3N88_07192 [Mikania micrantha]|uniref:BHLH domain-containing protein n=1 Tax=Mikania micrantha TaxID=192012 RepID=A0A5N6PS82_9ASTR|nr:hypothetical protein E3N88_07192 [Mikania micrantha]
MKKVVEQLQKALYNQLNTQKDSSEEEGAVGYIHAERVGREKINERMKLLQDIVPGCDKVTRKALILDEIINYVRSLQNQVEFLSMKLASVNPMLYDFGLDLDAFMLKPDEIMSSLALPIMPSAQQCSLDGGSATFAPSNDNYNYQLLPQLIDGSAATNSLLFQQAHVPNILLQTSSVSDDSGFATHLQGQSGHDVIYMIIKICDDILVILSSDLSISEESCETSTNTYLIGMETRMQELILSLKVGSGGVHMVGICGMWGSGKSTLTSSVYDEISHEFEGSCFVKNVRARSRIHGLKTLQEEILSNVLKSEVTFTNLEQGTYMMETRLREISVLIVLDDVHHIDHLKMLAGSQNWFGEGSRVIFTTRNQDLLNDHNVPTHNVRMLDDKEAIEAFSWHAFGIREPVQGFEEDSLSMVSKCGGHPLVLKSLGSFLHGKDRSEWRRILDRLEGIPVDEILKRFKIRDDGVVRNIFDQFLD